MTHLTNPKTTHEPPAGPPMAAPPESVEARCALLRAFVFDDPAAARPFSRRLADEQGWTPHYTARVLTEYRRFLELALLTPTAVTPSVDVDQAWHLHLAYTVSYWEDLCGRVLGRPLHHGPSRGGSAQRTHYRTQYEETLAQYAARFGHAPPADIWPPASERFAVGAEPVLVRPRTHWVLRKPTGPQWALGASLTVTALAVVAHSPWIAGIAGAVGLVSLSHLLPATPASPVPAPRTTKSRNGRADTGSSSSGCSAGWSSGSDCTDGGGDSGGGDGGCGGGCGGCGGGCG